MSDLHAAATAGPGEDDADSGRCHMTAVLTLNAPPTFIFCRPGADAAVTPSQTQLLQGAGVADAAAV